MTECSVQFVKLPIRILQHPDLTATAKLLFAVLKDQIDRNGCCWKGERRLARECGCKTNAVSDGVKQLEKANLIHVEHGGFTKSNRYYPGTDPVWENHTYGNSTRVENPDGDIVKNVSATCGKRTQIQKKTFKKERRRGQKKVSMAALPEIPESLKVRPGFPESWTNWQNHLQEIKKPLTTTTAVHQLKFLETKPDPVAVIEQAIRSGWRSLYPVKSGDTAPIAPPDEGQLITGLTRRTPSKEELTDLFGLIGNPDQPGADAIPTEEVHHGQLS